MFGRKFYTTADGIIDILGCKKKEIKIIDDTYKNRDIRIYDEYSPSIRAEREGFKVVKQI